MTDDTNDHFDDTILDATGLKCPLPVLKARKALSTMQAGAVLQVVATDPGAPEDLRHFCEAAGHKLLDQSETDGTNISRIAKGF